MKFKLYDREFYEKLEEKSLAPYATRSRGAVKTRMHAEKEHPYRTAFHRDRDRIIHSRAFRRLKHKQQVFLISEGDHYRTRLTHTLEVSQLSRTLSRALGLNELLVEAIALGHDLGHTPFGHVGEVVLNQILDGTDNLDSLLTGKNLGGFKHNYQSLRVLDFIEKKYIDFDGLNLTAFVREGILKHTRLLREEYQYPDFQYEGLYFELDHAMTLEGQVVAICDEIAQRTHDLEDGIRAGLVELEQVRKIAIMRKIEDSLNLKSMLSKDRYGYRNRIIRALINFLVDDVINKTLQNLKTFHRKKKRFHFFDEVIVQFSEAVDPLQMELNHFIYQEIIFKCAGSEMKNANKEILRKIFMGYLKRPELLPSYIIERLKRNFKIDFLNLKRKDFIQNERFVRIVADHVAGMTDSYATSEVKKLEIGNER
ncbi:MAG: dNTP triphosphohydrolase [Calditrichaeota bacterium]|nr:dNTP triphosphohydrolase [Calditrichota bacterium]